MRNLELARDYVRRAEIRLMALDVLYREKSWADVVRESQEIVELALTDEGETRSKLQITQSTVVNSFLAASATRFESVALLQSSVTARELDASDVMVGESLLRLDHALFSASDFDAVTIAECGRVRLVAGDGKRMQIASCREPLELYSMRMQGCTLDGALELDDTDVAGSRLGATQPTTFVSYNSRLVTVSLCEGVQSASLAGGAIECTACQGPFSEGEADVCSIGLNFASPLEANPCPAFASVGICERFPTRRRPR